MNGAQREQINDAISKATLLRFKSGMAMENTGFTLDETMELYQEASDAVRDAYRIVYDVWAGDVAKNVAGEAL